MSNIGDQIRMDELLKQLQGKDISNLTIILGKCTDCRHNRKSECSLGHRCFLREPSTFCCMDFIKKEERDGNYIRCIDA